MKTFAKRAGPRTDCEAPIILSTPDHLEINARLYNSSMHGMYFESNINVEPGMDVGVKMVNHLPHSCGPEAYLAYRVMVRWCREISRPIRPSYGIGAQYLVKSLVNHNFDVRDIKAICSLCDQIIPFGQIHETDHCVFLCTQCFSKMRKMNDGWLKECVNDFMIGNVI